MAVTILDTVNNQWYVQKSNGELEACHNAATAKHLRDVYNKERLEEYRRLSALISAPQLVLQEVV